MLKNVSGALFAQSPNVDADLFPIIHCIGVVITCVRTFDFTPQFVLIIETRAIIYNNYMPFPVMLAPDSIAACLILFKLKLQY